MDWQEGGPRQPGIDPALLERRRASNAALLKHQVSQLKVKIQLSTTWIFAVGAWLVSGPEVILHILSSEWTLHKRHLFYQVSALSLVLLLTGCQGLGRR